MERTLLWMLQSALSAELFAEHIACLLLTQVLQSP